MAKAPLHSSATAVPVLEPVAPQKVIAVSHGERAVTLRMAIRVDEGERKKEGGVGFACPLPRMEEPDGDLNRHVRGPDCVCPTRLCISHHPSVLGRATLLTGETCSRPEAGSWGVPIWIGASGESSAESPGVQTSVQLSAGCPACIHSSQVRYGRLRVFWAHWWVSEGMSLCRDPLEVGGTWPGAGGGGSPDVQVVPCSSDHKGGGPGLEASPTLRPCQGLWSRDL